MLRAASSTLLEIRNINTEGAKLIVEYKIVIDLAVCLYVFP